MPGGWMSMRVKCPGVKCPGYNLQLWCAKWESCVCVCVSFSWEWKVIFKAMSNTNWFIYKHDDWRLEYSLQNSGHNVWLLIFFPKSIFQLLYDLNYLPWFVLFICFVKMYEHDTLIRQKLMWHFI